MAIAQRAPIQVWVGDRVWSSPSVLAAIREFWRILNRVLDGWLKEVELVKGTLDKGGSQLLAGVDCLVALQWPFIQAFFTYITFFFMLYDAYRLVYVQLNKLNREMQLRIDHGKLPRQTEYIRTLWLIRNKSIAHFGDFGSVQGNPEEIADTAAGTYLEVFGDAPDGVVDFDSISFGGASVAGAKPREGKPLPATHQHCVDYLKQMDTVCDEYYGALASHLPLTVNGKTFRRTEWVRPGYFHLR